MGEEVTKVTGVEEAETVAGEAEIAAGEVEMAEVVEVEEAEIVEVVVEEGMVEEGAVRPSSTSYHPNREWVGESDYILSC